MNTSAQRRMSASTLSFSSEVNAAMLSLAEKGAVFVGQSVRYDGARIYDSLDGVPMEQRIEMPVIEDFQMGFCYGLALAGKLPVCIFPRMDFLVLALNQLVNHLDKAPAFGWFPKVIIRTTVGQKHPLDAGPQHTQNHTAALRLMLASIDVYEVNHARHIAPIYALAMSGLRSTVIVENPCE